jgi:hypothetical protein
LADKSEAYEEWKTFVCKTEKPENGWGQDEEEAL